MLDCSLPLYLRTRKKKASLSRSPPLSQSSFARASRSLANAFIANLQNIFNLLKDFVSSRKHFFTRGQSKASILCISLLELRDNRKRDGCSHTAKDGKRFSSKVWLVCIMITGYSYLKIPDRLTKLLPFMQVRNCGVQTALSKSKHLSTQQYDSRHCTYYIINVINFDTILTKTQTKSHVVYRC